MVELLHQSSLPSRLVERLLVIRPKMKYKHHLLASISPDYGPEPYLAYAELDYVIRQVSGRLAKQQEARWVLRGGGESKIRIPWIQYILRISPGIASDGVSCGPRFPHAHQPRSPDIPIPALTILHPMLPLLPKFFISVFNASTMLRPHTLRGRQCAARTPQAAASPSPPPHHGRRR